MRRQCPCGGPFLDQGHWNARHPHAERQRLLAMLDKHWSHADCELAFTSPHELLVATILSAQSTDAGVNKATPALFKAFPTPADYAKATPAQIEPYIRSIGLYRNKAKAIHAAMAALVENFRGQVPRSMDELLTLRGVARKTANVVLGNAFGIQMGIPVDTHVQRLAARFELVKPGTTVLAPMDGELYEWNWWLRVDYLAQADTTLIVDVGSQSVEAPLLKGAGHVYVPVTAGIDRVSLSVPADGAGVCVAGVRAGAAVPATSG